MARKHLRNRNVTSVEDSNEVNEISNIDRGGVDHEAGTVGSGMRVCESNNPDGTVTTEVSVGMSNRQLQDLLANAISTLNEQLDSKFQAATESITAKITAEISAKIQQENEKLYNEVRELSNDIRTLRDDTENKFQEVTKTIGGISDAMNERVDAHVVATRKMTDKIYQEMNARSGRLVEELKGHRTETENSLEEFKQNYDLFREQMKSELAARQD